MIKTGYDAMKTCHQNGYFTNDGQGSKLPQCRIHLRNCKCYRRPDNDSLCITLDDKFFFSSKLFVKFSQEYFNVTNKFLKKNLNQFWDNSYCGNSMSMLNIKNPFIFFMGEFKILLSIKTKFRPTKNTFSSLHLMHTSELDITQCSWPLRWFLNHSLKKLKTNVQSIMSLNKKLYILVGYNNNTREYDLPGGKVQYKEKIIRARNRELYEEMRTQIMPSVYNYQREDRAKFFSPKLYEFARCETRTCIITPIFLNNNYKIDLLNDNIIISSKNRNENLRGMWSVNENRANQE
jgi:hypothetical protein